MIVHKNKITFILFVLLVVTNILQIINNNSFYFLNMLSAFFIFIIPGFLCLRILKVKAPIWEYLSYVIAFSLSFLMFGGYIINLVLPFFHFMQPLSLYPLLIGLDISLLGLGVLAYKHSSDFIIPPVFQQYKTHDLLFIFIPFLFPILAVFGAIQINNNGSNSITMLLLGSIGVYSLVISLFNKKLHSAIYPVAIFFTGLSMLFMTSLRGWFITGHDIQHEYYVFQLTKAHLYWSMSFYKDAYNACLSITILPTIISSFLRMNDMYIYKIIFQIFFALCPVIVFLFLKKYTKTVYAYLASFYFISFPTFLNDMPMLNRQEIGFIFFCLLLLVNFHTSLSQKMKNLFFIIFGMSMVVSHYSTTYVTLALFGLTYIISFALKRRKIASFLLNNPVSQKIKTANTVNYQHFLNGFILLFLFFFTTLWYVQITKTSNGLSKTLIESFKNINSAFKDEGKSVDVGYSLFASHKVDDAKLLQQYMNVTVKDAQSTSSSNYYTKSVLDKYPISFLQQNKLPLTQFGSYLEQNHISVFTVNNISRQIAAKIIQLLIVFGLIGLFWYKAVRNLDIEYITLCIVGLLLLAMMIILPQFSVEYGLLRLFQQLLTLLALPVVIGSTFLINFLNENKKIYIGCIGGILFFLTLSGFLSTLTGGYYPQMNLNNDGLYYNAYYESKTDLNAIYWLAKNNTTNALVQGDTSSVTKYFVFANKYAVNQILPPIIRKDAYVYLDYTNIKNKSIVSIDKNTLIFNSPESFLNDNKNLVYSNGLSKIYK